MSNITVVTDTTETDNVTSISIEHDTGSFHPQEHDNKVINIQNISTATFNSVNVSINTGYDSPRQCFLHQFRKSET